VRHRRLSGAILAVTAGLLAAAGHSYGQAPAPPPRLLDLESQASPLPPTGWKVIATAPAVAGVPGLPRRPSGPIQAVVYEPQDPDPLQPAPARPFSGLSNGLVAGEAATPPGQSTTNAVKPPPGRTGAAAPAAATPNPHRAGTSLALEVVGASLASAGQAMPVEVIARNTGGGTLVGVRVEVLLPSGTRLLRSDPPAEIQGERLAWSVGTIPATAERHLRLEVQPAAGGEWTLTPTASFTVRQPFALSITGPGSVTPGAKVVFQVQVVNRTDKPMDKVVLRVQLPLGLFHPEAAKAQGRLDTTFNLAPGETRTLPLETRAVAPGRQVVDVATPPESSQQAPTARAAVVVAGPPLAVRLDGPRVAVLGRDFDLRLEVGNPNEAPAANAVLAQSVPQGLEVVAASPGATPAPGGQGILWPLGTLAPGQRRAFTCTLRPRAAGDWPLYAVASAETAGEARASHAIHVDGTPPLTLEVMGRDDTLTVGAETTYEVRVLNNSDLPATNVRLVAWMPEQLALVNPQGPTEARVQPAQVQFAPLAQLGPHGDAVYRVQARARQPGHGRFRVEMSADQLARPLLQECGALVREAR
jgi:uncharacterized repeat protein (TIGR01451 family)